MSDTTINLVITSTPQSISSLGGPAAGTEMRVANVGGLTAYYAISATLPDKTGFRELESSGYGSIVDFAAGESDVWIWVGVESSTTNINVETA